MLISILMYRIIMFSVLIILIITLTSQNVQSKVITVNTSGGTESTKCCVEGKCPCSSLSVALQHVKSNTIINITSEEIELEGDIKMGSGNLKNITVTSSIFTSIICSRGEDTIYCDSCDDVTVSGIAWHNCSLALGNISLINCSVKDIVRLIVSGSIRIERMSNYDLLQIDNVNYSDYVNLTIVETSWGSISVSDHKCLGQWNITIVNSSFKEGYRNNNSFNICADVFYGMHMVNITVKELTLGIGLELRALKGNISVSVLSSVFMCSVNAMECTLTTYSNDSYASVLISDTEFVDNGGHQYILHPVLSLKANNNSTFTLNNVNFTNNDLLLYVVLESNTEVYITNVNFIANINRENFLSDFNRSVVALVYIKIIGISNKLIFSHCNFINNTFNELLYINGNTTCGNGIVFDSCDIFNNNGTEIIYVNGLRYGDIQISNTIFHYNTVDDIIINPDTNFTVNISRSIFVSNTVKHSLLDFVDYLYLTSTQFMNNTGKCVFSHRGGTIYLTSSNFTNNIGSCVYLWQSYLYLNGRVLFQHNQANQGAALYIDYKSVVTINNRSDIVFYENSALLGGAIFVDLSYDECDQTVLVMTGNAKIWFYVNIARDRFSGDSVYFSVSKTCKVNTNISDPASFMYVLDNNAFYILPINYDISFSKFLSCFHHHIVVSVVVTSPHYLILCSSSNNVEQLENATYFISSAVLGKPIVLKAGVMDYFKSLSQPVQFRLNCFTCSSDVKLSSSEIVLVDNTSPLTLTFTGSKINFNVNVTVKFTSFLLDDYIQPIEAQAVVDLTPCFNHLGYTYSNEGKGCACYNVSVVKCSDHYNEIEDNYWIGNISSQPTTSLCPTSYCSFIHRNTFTLGYSELPDTVDAQCNDHRTGTACGQCSSDYTLAYDTTDCVSENDCSTIITVVVIISTCLYWLIVVVGVFTLLYYNRRIPLGYTYGIIYYYSMVGILFSNNLYISESVFLFISVLSSFTQLSPQFLGKLCLVKGLSGIDQLFLHYVHPVAVSLLVVVFVIAAKFSPKLSAFVSRCRIIRIICLLLLLSYTSIASTSLQLLRPLTFTDIAEVYTYTSPSIQYFHDRHALYVVVAIVSGLIVGIGLPLLLLLEPFVNKKINFVKIKPLLDEFQDCYKDKRKYRWFASYYLICRQVILLIIFIGNSNYNRMLFFLQITCIIIATIHMWVRPYKSASLNIFDGLILQIMVVSVAINTFTFLQPVATELVLIVVIFPLFVMCAIGIRQLIKRKVRGGEHTALPGDDARFVSYAISYVTAIAMYKPTAAVQHTWLVYSNITIVA